MKIKWSPESEDDLAAIYDYIAADNPAAADRVEQRLLDAADGLSMFPNRGRTGRLEGTRELVLSGSPYLIIYQIRTDALYIVRLMHGARRWPPASEER